MDIHQRRGASPPPPCSGDSGTSFRRLRTNFLWPRRRCLTWRCCTTFAVLLLVLLLIGPSIVDYFFIRNHASEMKFLKHDDCPLCFGMSMCGVLQGRQIQLHGLSQYPLFIGYNTRNVLFGSWHRGPQRQVAVVLKKLGPDLHLRGVHRNICFKVYGVRRPCTGAAPRQALWHHLGSDGAQGVEVEHAREANTDLSVCLSPRLFDRIRKRFRERTVPPSQGMFLRMDQLALLYAFKVNPEPLLLQAFPFQRSTWPYFPQYFGACGQWVVVENRGQPLDAFARSAPLKERLVVALALLKMARDFTTGIDGFSFYLGDYSWDNFVVNEAHRVALVDLSNLLVVDHQVFSRRPPGAPHAQPHVAIFDACPADNRSACQFTWDSEGLCDAASADFNFYAVCRKFLSPSYANEQSVGGLLPDLAEHPTAQGKEVAELMDRCAKPLAGDDRRHLILRLESKLKLIFEEMANA